VSIIVSIDAGGLDPLEPNDHLSSKCRISSRRKLQDCIVSRARPAIRDACFLSQFIGFLCLRQATLARRPGPMFSHVICRGSDPLHSCRRTMQNDPFHIGRAEMEHPRFMVIDPNDRMKVMAVPWMSPFADWVASPPRRAYYFRIGASGCRRSPSPPTLTRSISISAGWGSFARSLRTRWRQATLEQRATHVALMPQLRRNTPPG
jgi:hypothetical protein